MSRRLGVALYRFGMYISLLPVLRHLHLRVIQCFQQFASIPILTVREMLHRRPGAPSLGDPSTGQINPATPSSTNTNSAYEPLWRGSSDLYYTPASGPKARYNLPPASPHGHVPGGGSYIGRGGIPTPYGGVVSGGNGHANVGNGHGGNVGNGNGYGGNVGLTGNTGYGGTYDLTEGLEMSGGGMRGWTKMGKDEWKQVARGGFERFKRGLEDAGRLDRSWSLVWA